jgi:hypothetical protein
MELVRLAPVLGVGPGNWFVHYPRVTKAGDPSYAGHLRVPTNPWPSSDWVAFVTERGVVGALLLLLAGVIAAARAVSRRGLGTPGDAAASAALFGLLAGALVTGAFDAVLLLAAPAFLVSCATGLLLPDPGRNLPLFSGPKVVRATRGVVATLVLFLVLDAASRSAAVAQTGNRRDRETVARAARFAPGEHRLQLRLAEQGDCAAALRAAALMPYHPEVRALASKCSQ